MRGSPAQPSAQPEARPEAAPADEAEAIPALPAQLRHEFVQCEQLLKPLLLYYLLAVAQKLPTPALCFASSAENADRCCKPEPSSSHCFIRSYAYK